MHDCAKGLSDTQLIGTVKGGNIEISAVETENPELLHAKAGSILARSKYGVEDEDIISSIYYHTTGRPDMSLLEKIIFIADYIEPNRAHIPQIDSIRRIAFTDIDKAVALACKNTIDYLNGSSGKIDRITIETYDYYKDRGRE